MRLPILFIAFCAASLAQPISDGLRGTAGSTIDVSSAAVTRTIKAGTTPPATCTAGKDLFWNTNAAQGGRLLLCNATDTWAAEGAVGSGSIFTVMLNMQTAVSADLVTRTSSIGGLGTEAAKKLITPLACTARNLYVTTGNTQNAGGSLVVWLRNVSTTTDTALSVTVAAGATAGTYSNLANTASLSAGHEWVIVLDNNYVGGNSATLTTVSFTCN